MTLSDSPFGHEMTVSGFQNTTESQVGLFLSLGLAPAMRVRVIRSAPMGCPLQVKVGHSLLSIRRKEAACILVNEGSL
ncbi:FeoA family protein [Reinekea sp.]|jgi:ferrous iron transport protein A|uniref:FeoA family protein n=1 Tax=Reinekea sp. TaxID=1970455 RepID=UPI00398955C0